MSLAGAAKETLAVFEQGSYPAPSGAQVVLRESIDAAIAGTVLYTPEALDRLAPGARGASSARIEVTGETTAEAGSRLAQTEQVPRVVALNFASRETPGRRLHGRREGAGGGPRALLGALPVPAHAARTTTTPTARTARCSTRTTSSTRPRVPFFRDERSRCWSSPSSLSIITAPAPNAGRGARARSRPAAVELRRVLDARALKVSPVAAAHQATAPSSSARGAAASSATTLHDVAQAFADALARFAGSFDRVVFAVRDPGGRNIAAFQRQFGS